MRKDSAIVAITKKKKAGRPRMNDRKDMSAIFYLLRTCCKWQSMDGVITKAALGEKMYRFKSHKQS
jgi:transposase